MEFKNTVAAFSGAERRGNVGGEEGCASKKKFRRRPRLIDDYAEVSFLNASLHRAFVTHNAVGRWI